MGAPWDGLHRLPVPAAERALPAGPSHGTGKSHGTAFGTTKINFLLLLDISHQSLFSSPPALALLNRSFWVSVDPAHPSSVCFCSEHVSGGILEQVIVPIWILALYHAVAYAGSRFGSTQLWQQYGAKVQQVLSAYQVHASTKQSMYPEVWGSSHSACAGFLDCQGFK